MEEKKEMSEAQADEQAKVDAKTEAKYAAKKAEKAAKKAIEEKESKRADLKKKYQEEEEKQKGVGKKEVTSLVNMSLPTGTHMVKGQKVLLTGADVAHLEHHFSKLQLLDIIDDIEV